MNYRVVWVIDCNAESPEQAAKWCQQVQRTEGIADVFHVTNMDSGDVTVLDLSEKPNAVE